MKKSKGDSYEDIELQSIDPERVGNVAAFIADMACRLNLQVIMNSHWEIMQDIANKTWHTEDVDGTSVVNEIKPS